MKRLPRWIQFSLGAMALTGHRLSCAQRSDSQLTGLINTTPFSATYRLALLKTDGRCQEAQIVDAKFLELS
jgi:hypothetical protein